MKVDHLASVLGIDDLHARLDAVEHRLDQALQSDNAALSAATLRVTKGGGKRLRPVFTIAAANLTGTFDERVVSGATAVELVQVGSLVHDDVFEEAAERRGVPTINAVEGFNIAVMAGDYILSRAGEEAVRVSAEAARMLAATVIRLCEGQLAEMAEQYNPDRSLDSYFASIKAKTAILFATACQMGALCAGLDQAEVDRMSAFGDHFGMAFQLLDDVLDFVADPVKLGKPVGIDVLTGVYTHPLLVTLQRDGGGLAELLRRHRADDLLVVRRAVMESGGLDDTLALARDYATRAETVIAPLSAPMATLPHAYLDWAVDHFIQHQPSSPRTGTG